MTSTREPATRIVRRKLTRRDLFKAAPVGAAAGAALALGLHGTSAQARVTTRGVCRFCLFHCGIEATTEGGRLVRVQGDLESRTRGFLCIHGHALPEVVHSSERLAAPLVRRGGVLHEVDWAEALGVVAERFETMKQRYGAQSLVVQTGWPLVRHPLTAMLHRFCQAVGTPNLVSVASLCESSLRMGQALTVGTKYPHPVGTAKLMIAWGVNPERSAPPLAHVMFRCADEGRLIVVDPVRTTLARRAKEHVHLRPGTDGALALALAHVIIEEGLYDSAFVAEHVSGFEAFRLLAARFAPADVSGLTTVSTEQIVRVARRLGSDGPARIWGGLGVEHHESGVQTVRAMVALEALTGALDAEWAKSVYTPAGAHFADEPLPALYRLATPEPVPPPVAAKPLGYDTFPLFEVFNREAQGQLLTKAILEDVPYAVRGLVLFGSNPVLTSPGGTELLRALDALELMVVADPFLSATAARADVVLPASTFAESPTVPDRPGPRREDDADTKVSERGLVEPQHQAWPDWKILFELACALGASRYFPWQSLKEAQSQKTVPFMTDAVHQPRPVVANAPRFPTRTGKVELHSTLLEQFGHAPLPEWSPPSLGPDADWPLLLVSGPRDEVFINSQFHGTASVRAKVKEPRVRLHPSLGFAEGPA